MHQQQKQQQQLGLLMMDEFMTPASGFPHYAGLRKTSAEDKKLPQFPLFSFLGFGQYCSVGCGGKREETERESSWAYKQKEELKYVFRGERDR